MALDVNRRYAWPMSSVDEILATIRRLPLPERRRLIERALLEAAEDTPTAPSVAALASPPSIDDLMAARLTPPPGVGPIRLEDMERAIAEGASSRGSL
jgi:hypothetical protein